MHALLSQWIAVYQVDASVDGALLLEMYTDSGAGTMVSPDFYEVNISDNISYNMACKSLPWQIAAGCHELMAAVAQP